MDNKIKISGPSRNFESIKKIDENGVEYWAARELMPILGYDKWQNAEEVITRAARACINSGQAVDNHFTVFSKMVEIGSSTVRKVKDYKLDRYACYLIAQNGDPKKPEIALAQTYFAVQTRRQEIFEQLSDSEKRLFIRNEVSGSNKKLFKTARQAGVNRFGLFNDAGYKGLYGTHLSEIEQKKQIKKGELLDRAGSTELAANLFRITQTDEKIKKDKITGERPATQAHFMVGGKVRQTIKDIGGVLLEHLPTEKHIKEVKREIKKLPKKYKNIRKILAIILFPVVLFQPLIASARYFDANDIFTDKELFNGNALSRTAIQRFLEAKNSVLKSVSAVVDGVPKLVSEMIYELGVQYGVSQKFLLAKLQHEQGLIEKATASEKALDWATGYSCYNGRCNEKYRGIYAQLDAAADVQKIYAERSQSIGYFQFSKGVESKTNDDVLVRPVNQATTNLYIYTPYKGGPSGIGGNYAFWRVWSRYFTERSFADGALLKDASTGEYWKIEKNKKRKFASEEFFLKDYQLSDATVVPSERLAYYQENAPIEFANNTVVKVMDSGLLYLLSDGQKRRIVGNKALAALGYRLAASEATLNPTETMEAKIAKFAEGEPITEQSVYPRGLVAKNEASGELFLIKDGERRPLEPGVKQVNFGNTEPVLVSAATLQTYKLGEPVRPREGAVVRNGNGQWYIVSNNEKHPVANGEIIRRLYGDSVYESAPTVESGALALVDTGDKIDYMDDAVPDPQPYQSYADRLAAAAEAAKIPKYFAVLEASRISEKLPIASPARIKIAFHNRGAAVWQKDKVGMKLIDENSDKSLLLFDNRLVLTADVAPGEMTEFVFTVNTPVAPTKIKEWFALEYKDDFGAWLEMAGGLIGQDIQVFSAPVAEIVSHDIPDAVSRRAKRPLNITVKIKNNNPKLSWTSRRTALILRDENGKESPFYDQYDWVSREVVGVPAGKSVIKGGEEGIIKFRLNPKKAAIGTYKLVFSLELKDKKQAVYINGLSVWEKEIRVEK